MILESGFLKTLYFLIMSRGIIELLAFGSSCLFYDFRVKFHLNYLIFRNISQINLNMNNIGLTYSVGMEKSE